MVAGEVRNLASRSARRQKRSKPSLKTPSRALIPVGAGRKRRGNNEQYRQCCHSVTDIMGEIASASDEQSRGIDKSHWRFRKWIASRNRTHRWSGISCRRSCAGRTGQSFNASVSAFRLAASPLTNKPQTPSRLPVSNHRHSHDCELLNKIQMGNILTSIY